MAATPEQKAIKHNEEKTPEYRALEAFIEDAYEKTMASGKVETASHCKQRSMDKYLSTPKMDKYLATSTELDNKKRKANSPLNSDQTDVDLDLSFEIRDTATGDSTTQPSDIGISEQITRAMGEIKGLIERERSESRDLLKSVERKVDGIHSSLKTHSDQLALLSDENNLLRARNGVVEGRLTRMEKVVDNLSEEILQINARSMRDNLVFNNIPETEGASTTRVILMKFLRDNLRVQPDELRKIDIGRCHRMGMKGHYTRSIVAVINDEGRRIIWKHVKNLKGQKFSIFTQLPRELSERKKLLMPTYKAARDQKIEAKWIGDKLLVSNNVVEAPRDRVEDVKLDITELASRLRVRRSTPVTHSKSTFQGSMVIIDTPDEVVPALHAIYSDISSARATHNIYAYRIQTDNGFVERYSDDGEYGAGRRLLDLLVKSDVTNHLVCVSRWYGGQHLGPARFDYIMEAAKDVISQ